MGSLDERWEATLHCYPDPPSAPCNSYKVVTEHAINAYPILAGPLEKEVADRIVREHNVMLEITRIYREDQEPGLRQRWAKNGEGDYERVQ